MIKKTVQDAINSQIVKEIYSANLYLAMAAYFHSINLNGFANWMRVQAQEENFHAMKFFDYLLERSGDAKIGSIAEPPAKWDSPLKAFEEVLKHEEGVTASINALADVAMKESDHASSIMLQWFISEQVEEESTASDIVARLRLAGDSKGGLFLMDNELKTRVFIPPVSAKP
ncbi:MAG: ferritin [Bacteroidota bacterium]|jgi:ferritin